MEAKNRGHVVMIPLPQQGHTTPMLQFAQLLMDNNVLVTFLSPERTYHSLSKPQSTPRIRFLTFPEPPQQPSPMQFFEYAKYVDAVEASAVAAIDAIVKEQDQESCTLPRVSAVICDGVYRRPLQQTARKHGLAIVKFFVTSATSTVLPFHSFLLFEQGLLPPPKDKAALEEFMENPLEVIQSMPWLRGRDLLSFQHFLEAPLPMRKILEDWLDALVINTWDDIEAFALADLNSADIYAGKAMGIGPMQAWTGGKTPVGSSLHREDKRCLQWLDQHKSRTVVYVAFGSTGVVSAQELSEMAHGLSDSGHPVLWVTSKNSAGAAGVPAEMLEEEASLNERWCLVEWAPQREVLGHPAVGAYVTHGGWISAHEAMLAGVPLLCGCSGFTDQALNRRFLSHVRRAGVQLNQGYTRDDVVKCVKAVMDPGHPVSCDLRRNVELMRASAMAAVADGGSSHANLRRLLQIISPAD